MPLSILNAGVSWALVPLALAAAQQAGAGGATQPNASALIRSGMGTSWGLVPLVPTAAKLDASAGAAQAYASGLITVGQGVSWNLAARIAQPKIAAQRGAGGATQDNAAGLLVVNAGASWALSSRLLAARFSFTISPDGFSVLFASTTGDAPNLVAWEYGDGETGGGPAPAHVYASVATFTVTLTATRSRGFEAAPLTSKAARSVTITGGPEPDESLEDVLNLELGRHEYEPIRTHGQDVGENVSFHDEALNLGPGQLASLLFFTPARSIRVRQVTATGSGDGLYRLILNGSVIDVKRSYATQRNVRFDIEDELKLTVIDTLEVQVINASTLSQSYEGALLGRTI